MSEVLVAFATRNGSTEAVAEVVAATMRAAGETVELRLARSVVVARPRAGDRGHPGPAETTSFWGT